MDNSLTLLVDAIFRGLPVSVRAVGPEDHITEEVSVSFSGLRWTGSSVEWRAALKEAAAKEAK